MLRAEVWQAYTAGARALASSVAPVSRVVDVHLDTDLTAIHRDAPGGSLEEFLADFVRRIAIWTLAPRLLGTAVGGEACATALQGVVELFPRAWRIVDDVQDIDSDAATGVTSCVWHSLDADGRRAWDAYHAASLAPGDRRAESWAALSEAAWRSGCVPRLLEDANGYLADAARTGAVRGWSGIAAELDGLTVRRPA
jgi:hypothetical protein